MKKWQPPYILASGSKRRAVLLQETGMSTTISKPPIDDSLFQIGDINPRRWVQSLAVLKAMAVQQSVEQSCGTIIAADTVCVVDGVLFGQPEDRREALHMLQSMNDKKHFVCTGWCLTSIGKEHIHVECDETEVTIGQLDQREIDTYLSSDAWIGKAGAYNVSERIDAGWDIQCAGDMTSVMGLPMKRLIAEIEQQ